MTIVGQRPRPWVLVIGDAAEDVREALEATAKTVDYVDEFRPNLSVRVSDYDAIVLFRQVDADEIPPGLCIIEFSTDPTSDMFQVKNNDGTVSHRFLIGSRSDGVAKLLSVNDSAPPSILQLARDSLAPWLLQNSPRQLLTTYRLSSQGFRMELDALSAFPLVSEVDGRPCAAIWTRPEGSKEREAHHWWLPRDSPRKGDWIKAAIETWTTKFPDRFPVDGRSDWTRSVAWRTEAEALAAGEVDKAQKNLESEVARLRAEHEEKIAELERVHDSANFAERLLLTSQGEDLKNETHRTLEEFGFIVVDSDEAKLEQSSALMEDLTVSVEGEEWLAIVEVRGYARGAKTSDFQRLGRAARRYEQEKGKEPDARWYIVNHHLKDAPDDRPRALQGADADVDEFAADNGLVIDSRTLYLLRERVKGGSLRAADLRARLINAAGLLDLDTAAGTPAPGPNA